MINCSRVFRSKVLLLCGFTLFLASCASKDNEHQSIVGLSANRQMGIAVRNLNPAGSKNSPTELSTYFLKLAEKAIADAYGSKMIALNLSNTGPLESAENLYQIGKYEIDDLFVIEPTLKGAFQIPTASATSSGEATIQAVDAGTVEDAASFNVSIYNGSNLRAVNVFNIHSNLRPTEAFEKTFTEAMKSNALRVFPNPNIYPKHETKHFANLLFVFSEQYEKNQNSQLTCETVAERYKYYRWAKELLDRAVSRSSAGTIGTQDEMLQLSSRQIEADQKSKVIDSCAADISKTFELSVDYGSINAENQVFVKRAFDTSNFETLLKQYTNKPVSFRFQVEQRGQLSLFVSIRFDPIRYKSWTMNRVPDRLRNFKILSLDPYYALMQKLILFRNSLPSDAPFSLKSSFEQMRIMLYLNTLLSGEVSFAVDGKYSKDDNRFSLAYPNTVYYSAPGFDNHSIVNKDPNIFQEKGWIALGNCKTIEGTRTEDGLIYEFFGFPCQ